MKNFWKDFKAFISKGNIVDLAIAVVVGGAFGKIVTSLVNDIIMPLISLATGGVSVSDWKWVFTPGSENVAESALYYGSFIQTILDFLIIAFFIFLAIRLLQKSKTKLEKLTNEIKQDIKKTKRQKRKLLKNKNTTDIMETESIEEEKLIEENSDDNPMESNKTDEVVIDTKEIETNTKLIKSIEKMTKDSKQSNKAQEELLKEIRDLLKTNN